MLENSLMETTLNIYNVGLPLEALQFFGMLLPPCGTRRCVGQFTDQTLSDLP